MKAFSLPVMALLCAATSLVTLTSTAFAESSDPMVINVRQTGPAPTQTRRIQRADVVSLRGDPNFVDRQFLATEEKDNKMFARLETRELEGITVRVPKSSTSGKQASASSSKAPQSSAKSKVAGKSSKPGKTAKRANRSVASADKTRTR